MRFLGYKMNGRELMGRLEIEFLVSRKDLVSALMAFWEIGGTSLLGGQRKTREAVIRIFSAMVRQYGASLPLIDPAYKDRLKHAEKIVDQLFPDLKNRSL